MNLSYNPNNRKRKKLRSASLHNFVATSFTLLSIIAINQIIVNAVNLLIAIFRKLCSHADSVGWTQYTIGYSHTWGRRIVLVKNPSIHNRLWHRFAARNRDRMLFESAKAAQLAFG